MTGGELGGQQRAATGSLRRGESPRPRWGRRQWGVTGLLLVVAAFAGGGGSIGSTFAANYSAQTSYPTTSMAAGTLNAPTTLTSSVSGNTVKLTWHVGANGTHQVVSEDDTRATATCSAAIANGSFTKITATISASATTYTDAAAATRTGTTPGDNVCYKVDTALLTSWTKSAYKGTRVGFYAASATLPVATAGAVTIKKTTTVAITFNQKVTAPSATYAVVCTFASPTNQVYLGDTGTTTAPTKKPTACSTADHVNFGILQSSVALTNPGLYNAVTYTSATGTTKVTLKITATKAGTKTHVTAGATWTFIPAGNLKWKTSPAGSPLYACTANTHTAKLCRPLATNNF